MKRIVIYCDRAGALKLKSILAMREMSLSAWFREVIAQELKGKK